MSSLTDSYLQQFFRIKYSTQPWQTRLQKWISLRILDINISLLCRRMRRTSVRDEEGTFEDIPLAKTTFERRYLKKNSYAIILVTETASRSRRSKFSTDGNTWINSAIVQVFQLISSTFLSPTSAAWNETLKDGLAHAVWKNITLTPPFEFLLRRNRPKSQHGP